MEARLEQGGTAPRWLDVEERAAWMSVLQVLSRLPAALDAQLEGAAGLDLFEYLVLAMLSEQPTRSLRMSHLAEVTHASPSRLSNVAKRLERRGLLHREADPEDGRGTRAVLTSQGMDLVVRVAPAHVHAVRELIVDAVTPVQLRHLRAASDRIVGRLDALSPEVPVAPAPGARQSRRLR